MRLVLMCNNWMGWQVARWLAQQNESIVGVVVHPPGKGSYINHILQDSGVSSDRVFVADDLNSPHVLAAIRAEKPDLGISILFNYVLKPKLIDLFSGGCLNLHPALLPYNRGQYPNVWSIVDQTPAGVTLHYIDAGIDTGDIIAQQEVVIEPTDTGESLYRKLERAGVELFKRTWTAVRSGDISRRPQDQQAGSTHRARDVDQIDEIHLDQHYTAGDLINIIRARTFVSYPGAFYVDHGKKIYMRMQLMHEEELAEDGNYEYQNNQDC